MGSFQWLDEFGFHQSMEATRGISIVMFTSAGCSSCRAWKTILQEFGHERPGINLFEVDAGHAQALAREFAVFHLPALFVYKDGQYHAAMQCEARRDVIEKTLAALLARPAQEAP